MLKTASEPPHTTHTRTKHTHTRTRTQHTNHTETVFLLNSTHFLRERGLWEVSVFSGMLGSSADTCTAPILRDIQLAVQAYEVEYESGGMCSGQLLAFSCDRTQFVWFSGALYTGVCTQVQGPGAPGSGGADARYLSRGLCLPQLLASVRVAEQTPRVTFRPNHHHHRLWLGIAVESIRCTHRRVRIDSHVVHARSAPPPLPDVPTQELLFLRSLLRNSSCRHGC